MSNELSNSWNMLKVETYLSRINVILYLTDLIASASNEFKWKQKTG